DKLLKTDNTRPYAQRVSYDAPGTYLFKVEAEDNQGNLASDQVQVTIGNASQDPTTDQITTLSPIHDAFLSYKTRYNNKDLRVEKGRRISYLMFDLSGVTAPILKATLKLSEGTDEGKGTVEVRQGSHSNWTETNLSVANKPSATSVLGSLSGEFLSGNTYNFDLTGLQGGGKITLMLVQASGDDIAFLSSESGNAELHPSLVITTGTNARTLSGEFKTIDVDQPKDLVVPEEQFQTVTTYPNPASEYITVSSTTIDAKYSIISREGLVAQSGILGNDGQIDVRELKEGIYYLQLINDDKATFHKVLIAH
ncbi:MAG: DNRLRE domain-containing protein, partial [Bacteroidota bacterium]